MISPAIHGVVANVNTSESEPAPLWTPADITTRAWLDADDASTLTLSGSNVSQWRDKSGGGRHFNQGTNADRPSSEHSLNGRNVLRFNSKRMDGSAASQYFTTTNFWFALVARVVSVTSNNGNWFFNQGFAGGAGGAVGLYCRSSGIIGIGAGSGSQVASVSHTNFIGNWIIVVGGSNTSSLRIALNGGSLIIGSTVTTSALGTAMQIGAVYERLPDSYLAEMCLGNVALSSDIKSLMEGYLAHKWGLSSQLPNDHPYKAIAP